VCTVSYIPIAKEEFILTTNRDEAPSREATEVVCQHRNEKKLLFPRDQTGKGTWVAVSSANQLVCILNGAFVKHKHQPPYTMSRGIMALAFFEYQDAFTFIEQFAFNGIEPFTMIIYDRGHLIELRWDESVKHVKQLNVTMPHLWASCTLYPPSWQNKRQKWFEDWQLKGKGLNQPSIVSFHKYAGEGNPEYDLVMNRNNLVQTISITSIKKTKDQLEMYHESLLSGKVHCEGIYVR